MDHIQLNCYICGKLCVKSPAETTRRRFYCFDCFSHEPFNGKAREDAVGDSDFIYYVEGGKIKWFFIYSSDMELGLLINVWFKRTSIFDKNMVHVYSVDSIIDIPKTKEESFNLIKMIMTFN